MDPLSLTASIIAVLQLTSTLISCINQTRHATAEQKKVAVEASNLYSLLISLRFRVEEAQSNDPWFNEVKLLGMHNGLLDQFKSILETIVNNISPSRQRHQILSVIRWRLTKREVEDALARMERLKSLINCAMTNDLVALSRDLGKGVASIKEQTQQLCFGMERWQTQMDQGQQIRLSQWLRIPDPSTNYQAALYKWHPNTGQWLLKGSDFANWKDSMFSLMWLHGSAGCGKTVLSAASLNHILWYKESYPDTMVSYFYFDFNDMEKQSSGKAIRSLLFQLALQAPDTFQKLEILYQKCNNGQQQPAEDVFLSMLREAVAFPGQKFIILDALDECTDRESLLFFIRKLVSTKPQGLHILATSRKEKDIEDELGSIAMPKIDIQSDIVDTDIRIYIRDRMAADTRLRKWPALVQSEITTALMDKADGMFRWVYCQLEIIRQCVKLSALRKALLSLPKTLDETYNRILQGLDLIGQLPDALRALQWLCFSQHPLSLAEMVDILAIDTGDQGGFSPEERLPDPTDITVICSSLISLNAVSEEGHDSISDDHRNGEHKFRVQLAHFSVKQFLLSERCAFNLDFGLRLCHSFVAESCLRYLLHLCRERPLTEESIKRYPLSAYAARYWWQHLHSIEGLPDTTLIDLASQLLTTEDDSLLSWVQLFNIDKPWQGFDPSISASDLAAPLYYSARMGIPAVVEKIIRGAIDVNAQGGRYGTALQAASYGGHEAVVKTLLNARADVNIVGGRYGHALYAAAICGYENVVKMLLDFGAKIDALGGQYGTALCAASDRGHEKVVKLLLDSKADVDASGGQYSSALQAASLRGHEVIVKMLLGAGADANAQGGDYGTVLQAASERGHGTIVKILLEAGADVNARGEEYCSALQAASYRGHHAVVQMLLGAGADVNTQGGFLGNALRAARNAGHENVVNALLAAGGVDNS